MSLLLLGIDALVERMDRLVVGQHAAKRSLAYLAFVQTARAVASQRGRRLAMRSPHTLLIGPSGSGKTQLFRAVASAADPLPHLLESATAYTSNGYVGGSPEELPTRLAATSRARPELAAFGIIGLDEIDKIAAHASQDLDVSGRTLQAGFLQILSGGVATDPKAGTSFDTSQLAVVGLGTFQGRSQADSLASIVLRRLETVGSPDRLGDEGGMPLTSFWRELDGPPPEDHLLSQATTADLERFGFIREFAARFEHRVVVGALGPSEIARIIVRPDGALGSQTELFSAFGIRLEFEPEAVWHLAENVHAQGMGARGMAGIERTTQGLVARLERFVEDGVNRIVVTLECVREGHEPRLEIGPRDEAVLSFGSDRVLGPAPTLWDLPPCRTSDTRGWPELWVRKRLVDQRDRAGFERASSGAARWWLAFEASHEDQEPSLPLMVAEELVHQGLTVQDLYVSYVLCGCPDPRTVLLLAMHRKRRREHEARSGDTPERSANRPPKCEDVNIEGSLPEDDALGRRRLEGESLRWWTELVATVGAARLEPCLERMLARRLTLPAVAAAALASGEPFSVAAFSGWIRAAEEAMAESPDREDDPFPLEPWEESSDDRDELDGDEFDDLDGYIDSDGEGASRRRG